MAAKGPCEPGVEVHAFNSSSWKVKAVYGLKVSLFQDSLGEIEKGI